MTYGTPLRRCQSPILTAAARTRTRTSSSLTTGWSMARSSRTSGEPYLSWTIAFIAFSWPSPNLVLLLGSPRYPGPMVGPTLPSSGFRARSAGRPLERQATARSRYGLPGVGTHSRPEQWPRSSWRAALPLALVARASEARLTRVEWTRRGERARERRRRARCRLEAGSRVLHMLG